MATVPDPVVSEADVPAREAGDPGGFAATADPVIDDTATAPVLKRPDVTAAQLVAMVPIAAKLGAAFGIYALSVAQQGALSDAITAVIALVGADAVIRVGRALGLRR